MPVTTVGDKIEITIDDSDLQHSTKSFLDKIRSAIALSLGEAGNPIDIGGRLEQAAVTVPLNEAINGLKKAVAENTALKDFIVATKKKEISGKESFLTQIDHAVAACDDQTKKYDVDMSVVKSGLEKLKTAFRDAVDKVEIPVTTTKAKPAIEEITGEQAALAMKGAVSENDPEWLIKSRVRYEEEENFNKKRGTAPQSKPWGRG